MSNPGDHDNSKASGQAAHGSERDGAKAAYEAKQAKDVKASVDRQKGADSMQRQEPARKATKEPQAEGHHDHTHDHLKPQSPFHLDKRESQEKDNDYYHGMSQ